MAVAIVDGLFDVDELEACQANTVVPDHRGFDAPEAKSFVTNLSEQVEIIYRHLREQPEYTADLTEFSRERFGVKAGNNRVTKWCDEIEKRYNVATFFDPDIEPGVIGLIFDAPVTVGDILRSIGVPTFEEEDE